MHDISPFIYHFIIKTTLSVKPNDAYIVMCLRQNGTIAEVVWCGVDVC